MAKTSINPGGDAWYVLLRDFIYVTLKNVTQFEKLDVTDISVGDNLRSTFTDANGNPYVVVLSSTDAALPSSDGNSYETVAGGIALPKPFYNDHVYLNDEMKRVKPSDVPIKMSYYVYYDADNKEVGRVPMAEFLGHGSEPPMLIGT